MIVTGDMCVRVVDVLKQEGNNIAGMSRLALAVQALQNMFGILTVLH